MNTRRKRMQWALVVMTAALIYVLTLLLGLAASVPALLLSHGGHLDAQSAVLASALLSAILVIVVTTGGACWVARIVDQAAVLHGFLVGLLVALLSGLLDLLFSRAIRPIGLVLYALMVLAGWLGGALGAHWRRPSAPQEP